RRPRAWVLPCQSDIASELVLQRGALVGAQAADPTRLGDAEALHDLLGADLTDARHRLKQSRHLHLADDVIGLALLEDLGQGRRPFLHSVLDLRTVFAGLGGLLKRRRPLIGGKRRKSHAWSPRVSYRKSRSARGN